jgi:hypothetical protein
MTSKLDELLGRQPFLPFVITTEDGDSISIANPRKALVGNQMVVIADDGGRLHHIPFATITHIGEPSRAPGNGGDKKLVNFRLDPEVLRQLKMLAVEKGKPMQALLCDGLNKIFIENNRPPIAK